MDEWRRLDGRVFAMHLVRLALALAPIAVVLALGGELNRSVAITLAALFGGRALAVAADALRWRTTRYRITGERVELRSGLLRRSDRSVPRDRIRTVNVTAKPLHRLLGLAIVDVGTGRHGGTGEHGGLVLDAVAAGEADRLRHDLLARGAAGTAGDDTIARLRWAWLPYDLLSPWTLALPLIVLGGGLQLLDALGIQAAAFDAARDGAEHVDEVPLALAVALAASALLVVGAVAAAALFVESWWGFTLTREPSGTLRVRRGLLTARSTSIEQRRMRGVELARPLLLRAAGGATLHAIATGLRSDGDGKSVRATALLPSVPRGEAERVADAVLREPALGQPLRRHPPAALRRRLVRATAAVGLLAVALALARAPLGWLPPWWAALPLIVPALALGRDAARGLGHGVSGRHLLTRHGTFVRRTHALQRDGVIGWTARRSLFQRRAGLVTLTATTAAGSGGYRIIDVGQREAVAFAEEAVPGIVAPFLERSSTTSAPAQP